ncbi:MAG: hypothetical protein JRI68_25390 [Deltaproteobacteria bacterium]|nr:hypothetical protein [Deltaproteobacteria bacterium]
MSPLEKRSLRVGTILLLVLLVLGLARNIAAELWLFPVFGGDADLAASWAYAVFVMTTNLFFFVGRIVAYVKLMGAGEIRDKALFLLILTIVTFAFTEGVAFLINRFSDNDAVHLTLGFWLPLRILRLIAAIVLIKMFVQAAREAGGQLPKALSGAYVGLAAISFIAGLVLILWRLTDGHAWAFESDSTAAAARAAVIGFRTGVYYLGEAIELVALVILLRLAK